MSRWRHWSSGTEERKSFSSFLKEGNPTGTGLQTPAEKARAMGLQSDGRGGYRDPKTGQLVARTVNNELAFYDPGPSGGIVADGNGGAYVTQAQPSWRDPRHGMAMTPPARPESKQEIAAVPYPTPARPPMGFNTFMQQKQDQAYDPENPEPMREPAEGEEEEPEAGGGLGEAAEWSASNPMPAAQQAQKRKEQQARIDATKPVTTAVQNRSPAAATHQTLDKFLSRNTVDQSPGKSGAKDRPDDGAPAPTQQAQPTPEPQVDTDGDGIDDRMEKYLGGMVGDMKGAKRQTAAMKKIMERLDHPVAGKRIRDFLRTAIQEDQRQRKDYKELSQFNDVDGALRFMTEGMGLQMKDGRITQGTPNREMRALGGAGMPGEGRGESRAIGFREHQALMDPERQEMIRNAAGGNTKELHKAALQNDISWDTATQIYDMMENSMQRKADTWGKPEAAQGTFTPMGPVEFLKDAEGNFTGETNIETLAKTDPEEYAKHFGNNGGNRNRGIFNTMKMLAQAAKGEFSGVPSFFDFDTSTPDHVQGRSSGAMEDGRFKDDPGNLAFDRRGLNQFKVSSQYENEEGERERDTLGSLLNAVGGVKGSLGKVERDETEYDDLLSSPNFKKWLAYRMEQSDFDPKKIAQRGGKGAIEAYPDSIEDFMNLDDDAIKQLVGKNESKNPLGLNFRNMSMLAPRPDQRPLTANTWGGAPGGGLEFNPLQGYRKALTAGALFNPEYRRQLQDFEDEISEKNWTDDRKQKEIAKRRRDIIAHNIFGPQKAAGSLYGMGQIGNEDFVEQLRSNATGQLSWLEEQNPELHGQLMEGLNSTLDGYRGDLDKKMPNGPYKFTEEELSPNMKESYVRAVMGSNFGRSKMPQSLVQLFDQEQGTPKKMVEGLDGDDLV